MGKLRPWTPPVPVAETLDPEFLEGVVDILFPPSDESRD